MSALSRPEFHSEEAAFSHLERVIWGDTPVCPHCGGALSIPGARRFDMIREALCEAFCAEVAVTPVPVGYAVRTPHLKSDGDYAAFYLRKGTTEGEFRIEDDGSTVAHLEAAGFDLDRDSRFEAFVELLTEHNVSYDDKEVLLTTSYMNMERLPKAAISFSYLMARVKDLELLVGSKTSP